MNKEIVSTPNAPAAIGPYSQAIVAGPFLFCSGQLGLDPATGDFAAGDVEAQAARSLMNLGNVLEAAGCTFDDVIVENVYTTNMPAFLKASAYRSTIYKKQFPTGTWLEVKGLALPEFMIEIELEAHKANP